jgi:urease accessory protein
MRALEEPAGLGGKTAPFLSGRRGRAAFGFDRIPARTFLARQHVGYPFHVTRPFYFDAEPAHLATIYLQSSSGGIYSADDLAIGIAAAPETAVHLTSQASTIVHDCRGQRAIQSIDITAGENAFVGFATDPLILFPGAEIEQQVIVSLAPGAAALIVDAFLSHDPASENRPFGLYRNVVDIADHTGRRLMVDRSSVRGKDLASPLSPQGAFTASASVFAAGISADALPPDAFESALEAPGILCGASALPNDAGIGLRILADGGVSLSKAIDTAFEAVFTARFGTKPGRRRK